MTDAMAIAGALVLVALLAWDGWRRYLTRGARSIEERLSATEETATEALGTAVEARDAAAEAHTKVVAVTNKVAMGRGR